LEDKIKKLNVIQKLGLRLLSRNQKDYNYLSFYIGGPDMQIGSLLPSWRIGQPIWSDWSTARAVSDGYKVSTYVYACIYRIMKSVASVPWNSKQYDRKTKEFIKNKDTDLQRLFDKPNKFMTGQDLIERQTAHLYLAGNGLWLKAIIGKTPRELWPIGPDGIHPIPDQFDYLRGYEYRTGDIIKNYDPAEIVHVMFCDPSNVYWGCSPLQAGARAVDTDVEAVKWNKVSLQNRAVSDGILSFKHDLDATQYAAAKAMFKEQHQGPLNAREPFVMGNEAQWLPMSLSPAEMDFIESRKMTREDICAIFQVPPPMIGIYDKATLANIETARKIFWLDTIIPLMEDLQDAYNLSISPDFGSDFKIEFDVSNVEAVREKFKEQIDNAFKLWTMGVPLADVNKRLELNLPENIPGSDTGFISAGLLPAGLALPNFPNENTPSGKEFELIAQKSIGPAAFKFIGIDTAEKRQIFGKAFDRLRIGWERNVAGNALNLFAQEGKEIAKIYPGGGHDGLDRYFKARADAWKMMLYAIYTEVIKDFGSRAFRSITGEGKSYKQFDPTIGFIIDWAVNNAAYRATLITDTSKFYANSRITLGIQEGKTVDEIAKDLRRYYDEDNAFRAMRMGRTEVVGASNFGSIAGARETNIKAMTKIWVTAEDDRVRESHSMMDGEEVDIEDLFSNDLDYPGDPGGDPEEVINCRCTTAYNAQGQEVEM